MKTKMRRLFSIMSGLALGLGLMLGMSVPAWAVNTIYNPASTYTGFGNLNANDTEVTIYEVSDKTWYVIANDASTVTLLSKQNLGFRTFNNSRSKGNNYENSDIRDFVRGLKGTNKPLAGISSALSDEPTLIDVSTAQGLSRTKLGPSVWWLSSPGSGNYSAAYVLGGGILTAGTSVDNSYYVRPAIKLDLTKVRFNASTNTFSLPPTLYPLWVGGTQVDSDNASNIDGNNKASYNAETNTLTLNGYTYTGNSEGIKYTGTGELQIVLTGTNTITTTTTGITSIDNLNFSGTGDLNVSTTGDTAGIHSADPIEFAVNKVSVSGKWGILCQNEDITISSGEVLATGTSYGIFTENASLIITGGKLVATGDTKAINHTVKNSIAGTGWTNTEGTQGKADIAINTTGTTLDYKKVQFPAVKTYTVIASDDGNGSASADPESGETGTKVTIKATPNNGCSFKEWEVISGGITLADKNSAETTFNIGSANVEVKAHFEKKSQPEPSPEPEPKPKRESKSEKKSEEHSSKPAVINPDTVEGYFLVNGQILPGVAMGKTKQGPAAQIVLNANRPTGWLEAFTFNMAISGKVDYTLKNGVLTIIIPLEYQKAGRTFAIMALDKNGKAWTFADIDKNPSTVTANINVEGYAFALIYKD